MSLKSKTAEKADKNSNFESNHIKADKIQMKINEKNKKSHLSFAEMKNQKSLEITYSLNV